MNSYGRRAVLLCLCALQIAAASEQAPRVLNVTNSKAGMFEVISSRMKPVGTGIALGGLVGAAIESEIHSSKDDEMKKQLLKSFPEASCSQPLLDAFSARLRASGAFDVQYASKRGPTVDISIDECGLHLADTAANQFASYVYLTVRFKADAPETWSEKIQISGRARHDFDEFVNQPGLVQSEMEDVLQRAGVRAADKIIYKK